MRIMNMRYQNRRVINMYQSSERFAYLQPNMSKVESTLHSEPISRSALSIPADKNRPAVDPVLPKINGEKHQGS